jgi:hypothetical protein
VPGPKPTPTAKNRLRGYPGKRARNHDEPQPAPTTADPPDDLTGAARELWDRLAPECVRLGMLTAIDRDEFADACLAKVQGHQLLLDPIREARGNAPDPRNVGLALLKYASSVFARYGVGASDRTRIHAVTTKPESKWARLVS